MSVGENERVLEASKLIIHGMHYSATTKEEKLNWLPSIRSNLVTIPTTLAVLAINYS
jgi:hypothetical protein